MWASQFKPANEPKRNLLTDILRLLKDVLIVANDFLNLKILGLCIDLLDRVLDDKQIKSNSPKL